MKEVYFRQAPSIINFIVLGVFLEESMNRKLLDGSHVPGFDVAINLIVKTKAPQKWKLIDMETGEEYIGQMPSETDTNHWKKS